MPMASILLLGIEFFNFKKISKKLIKTIYIVVERYSMKLSKTELKYDKSKQIQ